MEPLRTGNDPKQPGRPFPECNTWVQGSTPRFASPPNMATHRLHCLHRVFVTLGNSKHSSKRLSVEWGTYWEYGYPKPLLFSLLPLTTGYLKIFHHLPHHFPVASLPLLPLSKPHLLRADVFDARPPETQGFHCAPRHVAIGYQSVLLVSIHHQKSIHNVPSSKTSSLKSMVINQLLLQTSVIHA